jgi:hypothetical protein
MNIDILKAKLTFIQYSIYSVVKKPSELAHT